MTLTVPAALLGTYTRTGMSATAGARPGPRAPA